MSHNALSRNSESKAKEVCSDIELCEEATKLLKGHVNPRQYIEILTEKKLLFDAIKVLSRALPKPKAISWAFKCLKEDFKEKDEKQDYECANAVSKWLENPIEVNRLLAMEMAKTAQYKTSMSWIATAVAWSGENIANPNEGVLLPADNLTAAAISGALGIAASKNPEKYDQCQLQYLKKGLEISEFND